MAVTIVSLADKTKSRLVAAGNDQLYYEDVDVAAGDMVKLVASDGDIDTSDTCHIFSAYGKAFVVNGENLKVADFQNVKLTTADVGANPPDFQTILKGGTSGAGMVVDYITTLSGACTVYGYRTTEETFANAETVTGTDDDGNAISFALSAAEVAPPHWYDWTPYGNSSDYGALPDRAYIGCVNGGRCMLSGDRNYPHQIRTSAIGNPWDWNVSRTAPTRAMAIGAGAAGAIGDIVRALIPARDNHLFIGCANSVHLLNGNPADGGQLFAVDKTVGIFDATSWCFDGDNNLYFWGTGGIYKLSKGAVTLESMTRQPLPKLIQDEAADPSTHRITMGYDPDRVGIKICITKLADGTSSNYWYDLQTGGFFPDAHQEAHGVYSMFFYDANDVDYKALLMGCKDGYIRVHDDDADDDDGSAIDSYVWFGPLPFGENYGEGSISNLRATLTGGASGGSAADSNSVAFGVYASESAEDVIELMDDAGAVPEFGGTFSMANTRRQKRRRQKARGRYGAIKLGNSANDETWGLEKLHVGG